MQEERSKQGLPSLGEAALTDGRRVGRDAAFSHNTVVHMRGRDTEEARCVLCASYRVPDGTNAMGRVVSEAKISVGDHEAMVPLHQVLESRYYVPDDRKKTIVRAGMLVESHDLQKKHTVDYVWKRLRAGREVWLDMVFYSKHFITAVPCAGGWVRQGSRVWLR